MLPRSLAAAIQGLLQHFGYRIVRTNGMPLADLGVFCSQIAARGFKPTHIMDVGANKGEWSRTVKQTFSNAAFTLIEPQIEMRPFLDRFCTESPGARWLNVGAGAEMGELKLSIFPDTVSTSFAITEDRAQQMGLSQRIVPVLTLDHICANIIHVIPDLVKMDVEGFEYEVLKGSTTLLGKTEVFLLELCFFQPRVNAKSFYEMVAIMADFGYRPYDFTMFLPRPRDRALGVCEMVFVRDQGSLRAFRGWQ